MAGTNKRSFGGRAVLIMESADNKAYVTITLSSVSIAGSTLTGTVVGAPATFTDGPDGNGYITQIRAIHGV